jgi:hypothetical protein
MSDEISGVFTLELSTPSVRGPSRFGGKIGAVLAALFYAGAGLGLGTLAGALLGIVGQDVSAFAVNGAIMGLGIGAAVGLPAAVGQFTAR